MARQHFKDSTLTHIVWFIPIKCDSEGYSYGHSVVVFINYNKIVSDNVQYQEVFMGGSAHCSSLQTRWNQRHNVEVTFENSFTFLSVISCKHVCFVDCDLR